MKNLHEKVEIQSLRCSLQDKDALHVALNNAIRGFEITNNVATCSLHAEQSKEVA